ncbi:hypothetical protein B484DRAFT_449925 [Ochromonadaceae sp. CCMP2298]|nr:hypothetical protein B484DRAFT_449925 [Ochromonadaceae sp. CCMP2298]|mmetsp:Transcript_21024/g.46703  ORF Transcript_21024/g.46703 Transcript_21024/m.46703 type:complete len:516 (+) Transcript_21024:102-1649(+)
MTGASFPARWLALLLVGGSALLAAGFHSSAHFLHPHTTLTRARPLSTAGSMHINSDGSSIPRLEPGLRQMRVVFQQQTHPTQFAPFSLAWLSRGEDVVEPTGGALLRRAGQGGRRAAAQMGRLFASAACGAERISCDALRSLRKLLATAALLAGSVSNAVLPNADAMAALRRGSIAAATALGTVALPGSSRVAHAGALGLSRYAQLSPTQRLATTPLFYVSNSRGNSYLQEDIQAGRPEQRIVTYFMSSEDAADYLDEMAQVNAYSANEFRLMTVSMEKVVGQIQSKKQSRKLGRYDVDMVYRIQPSSRQCANAESLVLNKGKVVASVATTTKGKGQGKNKGAEKAAAKAQKELESVAIPMFSAQGLAVRRGGGRGEVVTPFYFALEDLLQDWAAMREGGEGKEGVSLSVPAEPSVQVRDFSEVMLLAKGINADALRVQGDESVKGQSLKLSAAEKEQSGKGVKADTKAGAGKAEKAALQTAGIMPPRKEIDMVRRYYRNKAGLRNEFAKSKYMG